MARFAKQVQPKSVTEVLEDSFRDTVAAANLADLVNRRSAKKRSEERAKAAMLVLMEKLKDSEKARAEDEPSALKTVFNKVARIVGKKIFTAVARTTLRFAARVALNLVRLTAQAVLRYAIVPIMEFVAGVIIANPVTAAVAGLLLLGGGGYYVWKKFFGDQSSNSVDTTNVATQDTDVQDGTVAQVAGADNIKAQSKGKTLTDYVMAPVDYAKRLTGSKKFKGFGSDVDGYIKEAALKYHIPEDVLRGFIKMEDGWTGKMSPTGAIGTGQFTQPTWDALARTPEGAEIGMTVIGKRFRTPQDPRFDKHVNTLATGLLASKNAKLLREAGLPVTGENLYMLHNIGPGIIDVMLGKEASPKTLKAMQQNGMLKGQDAARFLEYQKGRFRDAYADANTGSTITGDKPRLAEGRTLEDTPPEAQETNSNKANPKLAANSPKADKTVIRGKGKSLIEVS